MKIKTLTFKAVLIFTLTLLLNTSLWAQTPEKMSYQAVIRDGNAELVTETQVGMQISILKGSANGTTVYTETQSPTTNVNGLISIEIGGGAGFDSIDWSNDIYFIKTETDPTGGTSYSITGISQLLSTPYALHAKSAESFTGTLTELDPRVPYGSQAGEMQSWNGNEWETVAAGSEGEIMTFVNNKPTWVGAAPVGTVTNPTTGETWMDKNLGASQVATASDDPNSYGDLYQWGRLTDGHEKRTSATTTTLSTTDIPGHGDFILAASSPEDWRNPQNGNLWQGVNGTNNPCPSGFRLPTEAEFAAERASWTSDNAAGAFASPLKLPTGGYRGNHDGLLNGVGSFGYYWPSTVNGNYTPGLYFYAGAVGFLNHGRAYGFSVRCIKD